MVPSAVAGVSRSLHRQRTAGAAFRRCPHGDSLCCALWISLCAVECVLLRGALHASRTFIVDRVLHQLPDNIWDAIQTRGPGWMLVTRVDEYVLNPNVAGRHQLVAWHMWARSARPYQPPSFYQCYTRIQGLLEQHGHDEVPSADVMMPTLHEQEANTASQSAPATLFVVEGQRRLPLHAHIIAESDNAPI